MPNLSNREAATAGEEAEDGELAHPDGPLVVDLVDADNGCLLYTSDAADE